MSTWVRNDEDGRGLSESWFAKGVPRPLADTGGLFVREYLNLETGARIVLLPTQGWKEARHTGVGCYQAWNIPPGECTAVRWNVRAPRTGREVPNGFGGPNASSEWSRAFNEMKNAIERTLDVDGETLDGRE